MAEDESAMEIDEPSALETRMKLCYILSSSSESSSSESEESGNESQEPSIECEASASACEASTSACEASTSACEASTSVCEASISPEDEEAACKTAVRRVRRKLIESGEMDKLQALAYKRLSDVKWRAQVVAKCREVLQDQGSAITYNQLYYGCRDRCMSMIPQSVKDEILQNVKRCFESKAKLQFQTES